MDDDLDVHRAHGPWSDPGRFTLLLAAIPPAPAGVVHAVAGGGRTASGTRKLQLTAQTSAGKVAEKPTLVCAPAFP